MVRQKVSRRVLPAFCALVLTACDTLSDSSHRDAHPNAGYSAHQIEALRNWLSKVSFPQPAGSIVTCFGIPQGSGGITIGDMAPDERGMFVVYIHTYFLSPDYALIVQEGHYKTPGGGTKRLDDSARIVRRRQL
jgi:hypothetical protein